MRTNPQLPTVPTPSTLPVAPAMPYAGSVFVRRPDAPPADLRLPRRCWRFYHALDGHTPAAALADRLHLSEADMAVVVETLRRHDLIAEPVETYAAFRAAQADVPSAAPSDDVAHVSETLADESHAAAQGDGAPTHGADDRALDLPALWSWLKDRADNVKDYKNKQTFVLVEAGDALAAAGIYETDDLEARETLNEPEAVRALERAIERNFQTPVPAHCYREPAAR
jgi:hypothetical protein